MFSHYTNFTKIWGRDLNKRKTQNNLLILHSVERLEIYLAKFVVPCSGFKIKYVTKKEKLDD